MPASLDQLRNVGIAAHIDAGKTTATERILYYSGVSYKMGEVHEGSAVMDYMPQEQERGITITSAATTCFWRDHQINIIDTPGHVDFTIEVERALRVLDGVIALFSAVDGVEPQSETVWVQANRYQVPRIAFINKMDRIGADFDGAVEQIRTRLGGNAVPFQMPYFVDEEFTGVIDLLAGVLYTFDEDSQGKEVTEGVVPEHLTDEFEAARESLIEALVEEDDELAERFLEGEEIGLDELRAVARSATVRQSIVPVLCGSAFKNKGVQPLLDAIVWLLPSPLDLPPIDAPFAQGDGSVQVVPDPEAPFVGMVFKILYDTYLGATTYVRVYQGSLKRGSPLLNVNRGMKERAMRMLRMHANKPEDVDLATAGDILAFVGLKKSKTGDTLVAGGKKVLLEQLDVPEPVIGVVIEPRSKADADTLETALQRLSMEDPSFRVQEDPESGQTVIYGMGELHLEIIVDRLTREHKAKANIGKPRVSYRETAGPEAAGRATYQRPGGGAEASARLTVAAGDRGSGLQLTFSDSGVSEDLHDACRAGVEESLNRGYLADFPIVDVVVAIDTIDVDDRDGRELSVKVACSYAMRDAFGNTAFDLLEPVMAVEVVVPEEYMGSVIGDLQSRRGKVTSVEARSERQVLTGEVPMAAMFGYATTLRSLTQGRGIHNMQFASYQPVPKAQAREIVVRVKGE